MILPKYEWERFAASINQWDDATEVPTPCQPIGCDNEIHLDKCYYDEEWNHENDDLQSMSEKKTSQMS